MNKSKRWVARSRRKMSIAAATLVAMVTALLIGAAGALAAPDPVTGIDYAEIGTDVLDAARPAVLAGVAILVLITAVKLGKKLWNKVSS